MYLSLIPQSVVVYLLGFTVWNVGYDNFYKVFKVFHLLVNILIWISASWKCSASRYSCVWWLEVFLADISYAIPPSTLCHVMFVFAGMVRPDIPNPTHVCSLYLHQPTEKIDWHNAGLLLGRRIRRRPNIEPPFHGCWALMWPEFLHGDFQLAQLLSGEPFDDTSCNPKYNVKMVTQQSENVDQMSV